MNYTLWLKFGKAQENDYCSLSKVYGAQGGYSTNDGRLVQQAINNVESPRVLEPERNLTERTAWVLQAYKSFVAMSENEFRRGKDGNEVEDAANWGSLEDIHNAVHVLVGGPESHMTSVPVSAFDPIFWLPS